MRSGTYIRYDNKLLELEEVKDLASCMGISRVEAGGYVALVVALAIAQADDDGQIDHLTTKAIESFCYWDGERGQLLESFLASGVFSGERDSDADPLSVSPSVWCTLAGPAIVQRVEARERKRKERAQKKGTGTTTKS